MSIREFSDFSENPSVSVFGVEKLIFSYEGILLFWKKESLKLYLSRWTEAKKKKKITAYCSANSSRWALLVILRRVVRTRDRDCITLLVLKM